MKIFKKIILIFICAICIFTTNIYATNSILSKNILETNIKSYTYGEKIVTTTLQNGDEITVGNSDPVNAPISLTMTESNIQLTSSTGTIDIFYEFSDKDCLFKINREVTPNTSVDELYLSLISPEILSICFLAVTDAYNIESENALKYYEELMDKHTSEISIENTETLDYSTFTKLIVENQGNVTDKVFTYSTNGTQSSEQQKYEYEVSLKIDLNKINSISTQKPDEPQKTPKPTPSPELGKDDSISPEKFPNAGKYTVFPVIILVLSIGIISIYIKNKYKDIK